MKAFIVVFLGAFVALSSGTAIKPRDEYTAEFICSTYEDAEDKLIPNYNDCTTFYQCDSKVPALVQCDDGLLFDPELFVCNWADVVECGSPICNGRRNGESVANEDECSSYYVCDYGRPKEVQCDDGLHYDPELAICNWADAVSCA